MRAAAPERPELDRRLDGQAARPAHVFAFDAHRFPAGCDPRSRLRPGESPHRSHQSRDEGRRMIVDQSTPYQGKFGPR